MSSAWGESWGDAWGDSWGIVPPTPAEAQAAANRLYGLTGSTGGYLTPTQWGPGVGPRPNPGVAKRKKERVIAGVLLMILAEDEG